MPSNRHVVIVHGLFMHGYVMKVLANNLKKKGWIPHLFSYRSARSSLSKDIADLKALSESIPNPRSVNFVGHSLGGLIIRAMFADGYTSTGRIVTLGTPHNGASIARELAGRGWGVLLGKSLNKGLLGELPPWTAASPLGSIAGSSRIGIRNVLINDNKETDGTVLVEETRLEGMRDHIIMPINHTALIYSKAVFRQTDHFLSHGYFAK